jgi:hypothetical protein
MIPAAAAFSFGDKPLGLLAEAVLEGIQLDQGKTILAKKGFFFSAAKAVFGKNKADKKICRWGKLVFLFELKFVIIKVNQRHKAIVFSIITFLWSGRSRKAPRKIF